MTEKLVSFVIFKRRHSKDLHHVFERRPLPLSDDAILDSYAIIDAYAIIDTYAIIDAYAIASTNAIIDTDAFIAVCVTIAIQAINPSVITSHVSRVDANTQVAVIHSHCATAEAGSVNSQIAVIHSHCATDEANSANSQIAIIHSHCATDEAGSYNSAASSAVCRATSFKALGIAE